jgi:hypothetical protein
MGADKDAERAATRGVMAGLVAVYGSAKRSDLPPLATWLQYVELHVSTCPRQVAVKGGSLALGAAIATQSILTNRRTVVDHAVTGQVRWAYYVLVESGVYVTHLVLASSAAHVQVFLDGTLGEISGVDDKVRACQKGHIRGLVLPKVGGGHDLGAAHPGAHAQPTEFLLHHVKTLADAASTVIHPWGGECECGARHLFVKQFVIGLFRLIGRVRC